MRILLRSFALGSLALFCAESSALADGCQDDLRLERPGMIKMNGPARAGTLTSREALSLIGKGGTLSFQRTIDDFWRIKVERSVNPDDLEIRYQISGGSDRRGFAVSQVTGNQKFPIRLIQNKPEILCEDNRYRIVSGGFTAQGRASNIGLAGLYEVEINVDVSKR